MKPGVALAIFVFLFFVCSFFMKGCEESSPPTIDRFKNEVTDICHWKECSTKGNEKVLAPVFTKKVVLGHTRKAGEVSYSESEDIELWLCPEHGEMARNRKWPLLPDEESSILWASFVSAGIITACVLAFLIKFVWKADLTKSQA